MQWLITYITINDYNAPQYLTTVNATTYTEALICFELKYKNAIALEIEKI